MRSELYDAVREATTDEFDLLAELGGGDEWSLFLGRAREGGGLALLLLQEAEDGGGQFDLEVVEAVEAGLPAGRTTCAACGADEAGWPRFCAECGADLSGVAADAGASDAELLEEVRGAAEGEYRVLGALPHAEGGGALYFAREEATDRVVGLALRQEADGELALVVSWTPEAAAPLPPLPEPEPVPDVAALSGDDDTEGYLGRYSSLSGSDDTTGYPYQYRSTPREESGTPPWGRRERPRRPGATALIAVFAVALVAAVVWAVIDPGARSGANAISPGPGVDAGTSIDSVAPTGTTPPTDSAARSGGDVATGAELPKREPAVPVQRTEPTTQPPTQSVTTVTLDTEEPKPGPIAVTLQDVTAETEAPEPPAAPTAEGVEAAVREYARAVGSCQTSRLSRAYPGITDSEIERWERVFRDRCENGLRTAFTAESTPVVNGTRAEQVFTLTLVSTGSTGNEVRQPLLLRAVLEWRGGAWSLREVRTLGAR